MGTGTTQRGSRTTHGRLLAKLRHWSHGIMLVYAQNRGFPVLAEGTERVRGWRDPAWVPGKHMHALWCWLEGRGEVQGSAHGHP